MQPTPGNLPATYQPADARRAALACATIKEALEQPTLNQLVNHAGHFAVVAEVAVVIEKGMDAFAMQRRLSPDHVMLWAKILVEDWKHDTLADLVLFLKGAGTGKYDGGEYYASMDVARIGRWWAKYLEEKADARAILHMGLVHQPDPWEALADELSALLRTRGDRKAEAEEAERERVLRAQMAELDKRRLETADRWRKLRMALKSDRKPIDNKSAEHDRLRREVPIMTADDLRAAWKKYTDAWSRRVILQEANHRGLVEAYLRDRFPIEEPGKAEADVIKSAGLAVPLPPNNLSR